MLPEAYRKKSFLKFDVPIDLDVLRSELQSIPRDAWASSYWGNVHCSVGMLLLRGGNAGHSKDFFCDEVVDHPPLADLPYMHALIGDQGPLGRARFAFLFRMEPNGVTLQHQDYIEAWHDLYRVHIPIITNPGAFLISNTRSCHLEAGFAWTFDNQSNHGVVNGPAARTHLIFDVPLSEPLKCALDRAERVVGTRDDRHVKRIRSKKLATRSYPGDPVMIDAIDRLRAEGLDDPAIAELFTAKQIPTRRYHLENGRHVASKWSAQSVDELRPRGGVAIS